MVRARCEEAGFQVLFIEMRCDDADVIEANIAHWAPPASTDVIFANAVFQWVPDHLKHLKRLLGTLSPGGVLAVQMPDNLDESSHILMREVAFMEPWRKQLSKAEAQAKRDARYAARKARR